MNENEQVLEVEILRLNSTLSLNLKNKDGNSETI